MEKCGDTHAKPQRLIQQRVVPLSWPNLFERKAQIFPLSGRDMNTWRTVLPLEIFVTTIAFNSWSNESDPIQ